ncbi:hypothetical protein ACFZAU_36930 [Streptomyces sp. NPDC008238]
MTSQINESSRKLPQAFTTRCGNVYRIVEELRPHAQLRGLNAVGEYANCDSPAPPESGRRQLPLARVAAADHTEALLTYPTMLGLAAGGNSKIPNFDEQHALKQRRTTDAASEPDRARSATGLRAELSDLADAVRMLIALTSAEHALLDARPWTTGACLLCGSTELPVTPFVTVYAADTATARAKCQPCVVTGLVAQRATAAALERPYVPTLPPIPEGSLMSPEPAATSVLSPAVRPAARPLPHRIGVLGLVWILGNSAALPLLWAQVTSAQHDRPPSAINAPDTKPKTI